MSNSKQRLAELTGYNSMTIRFDLLDAFTPGQAIVLQDLVRWYLLFDSMGKLTKDGYFWRSKSDRFKWTRIDVRSQERYLAFFRENGLIETKQIPDLPHLHFKINHEKIMEYVDNKLAELPLQKRGGGSTNCGGGGPQIAEPLLDKGKINISPLPPKGVKEKITSPGVPGKYSDDLLPKQTKPTKPMKDGIVNHWTYQVAELLGETVNQNKGRTPSKTLITWANQLNDFLFHTGYSKKRVLTVAALYANHFGEIEKGCTHPIGVYTMPQFCAKFLQLEAAMDRAEDEKEQDTPHDPSPTAQAIFKVVPFLAANELDNSLPKLEVQWTAITARLKDRAGPYEHNERWDSNEHILYFTYWKRDFTRAMVEYATWMVDNFERKYVTPRAFSPDSKMFSMYLDYLDEEHKVRLLR